MNNVHGASDASQFRVPARDDDDDDADNDDAETRAKFRYDFVRKCLMIIRNRERMILMSSIGRC